MVKPMILLEEKHGAFYGYSNYYKTNCKYTERI